MAIEPEIHAGLVAFRLAAAAIGRDVRLFELTDEEDEALVRAICVATEAPLRARIAKLEGERDQVLRNRDMWKSQCERQAEKLTQHTEVLAGAWWTIDHQPIAEAMCNAVTGCELGPSDDEGCLTLYDIIPEVWCAPNRSAVHKDLAERLAFAPLDAWLEATRKAIAAAEQGMSA